MTTQLRSRTKKTITPQDQKALILEIEELIKSRNEFIHHDAIFFCYNNIYYRVYFDAGYTMQYPCYEYKVTRSNCEKFFHPTKKERKMSVINNNYDPVWIEEFYYYPLSSSRKYRSNHGLKEIDYVKKYTFWLDGDCNIILK
jgi:hypothetical protein